MWYLQRPKRPETARVAGLQAEDSQDYQGLVLQGSQGPIGPTCLVEARAQLVATACLGLREKEENKQSILFYSSCCLRLAAATQGLQREGERII